MTLDLERLASLLLVTATLACVEPTPPDRARPN
jgi:hypothetical protein